MLVELTRRPTIIFIQIPASLIGLIFEVKQDNLSARFGFHDYPYTAIVGLYLILFHCIDIEDVSPYVTTRS